MAFRDNGTRIEAVAYESTEQANAFCARLRCELQSAQQERLQTEAALAESRNDLAISRAALQGRPGGGGLEAAEAVIATLRNPSRCAQFQSPYCARLSSDGTQAW